MLSDWRDNAPECFPHVLCHADLVGPPLKVKAQDGDSPFICDMRVYFAVSLFVGDHLTTPRETDESTIIREAFPLEPQSVTFKSPRHTVELAEMRHHTSAGKANSMWYPR